jgi:hypothetical protein
MFFSAKDLSNAKPVAEEDREEWTLGIVLVHYSMGAGTKKFRERGEAGVTKELTQMHNMDVFQPVARESLTKDRGCTGEFSHPKAKKKVLVPRTQQK